MRNRLNMNIAKSVFLIIFTGIIFWGCQQVNKAGNENTADVIIYGGTSAAVTAAVEVVHSGKSVIVVSPDIHLGGLSAGGLGFTDTGNKSTIGGLSREFYHRVWKHYNDSAAWIWEKHSEYGNKGQGTVAMDGENRTMWIFEPHVAEQVFEDFIVENNIPVDRDEWLDRKNGVQVEGGKITAITTLSGKNYQGKIFIDATYEGDLMAAAGISYHVGRESCSVYNEEWNGVQAGVFHHGHHFKSKIDPYVIPGDPSSGLLPKISAEKPGENCTGDDKVQAYCFRLCMSNHADNRVPFPKPDNYDPKDYELLVRVFEAGWNEWFNKFDMIPNRKTDTNNHGPFSSDNIGMNYDYPEASYERRKEIIKEHEDYQKGLLYFVSNDARVPDEVRTAMQNWGLAADEFTDNGNWPHQLYIREARRMIGEYVTSENDVLGKREVPQPIGMGSYTMDSHNIQRYVTEEGFVQNEGDLGIHPHQPYQISYGSIVPQKEECTNLLVPVAVSSSHIAFGSIRMEPVFMILGQSAAVAASIAIDKEKSVQDVQYDELKEKLISKNQKLSVSQL
ncbi:FAD-dependent oxidoreductase [Prolixibacteraceae bacterium Z1-6]|uniref:FAD-dependent oxidoreductase n=1 Tax=Draconibacterium aestuarii TaxID=2998507 RepID=A0A9X3J6V5_9BACT|nr:FAD-dependent oxidoreductase [Prolixibacteraceae bacterium Z1-6]